MFVGCVWSAKGVHKNFRTAKNLNKPTASEVLSCYLNQCQKPPWTSYFVKYSSIYDDQWGLSHFNWPVGQRLPCLAYGLAATILIKHEEIVVTPHGSVSIYFLYKEDKGSLY
ncbi:uncharacterized protein GBIM_03844 [Gryllus bimaculatus]|nr:uncharacterized protein GBIM_03844 [Gryllus bimaculatus]